MVVENLIKLMKRGYVCNHCLGRSVGNLLSGLTNEERGKILRTYIAMLIDSGKEFEIDLSNLVGYKFRNKKISLPKEKKKCWVCGNLFDEKLPRIVEKVLKKLKKYEFSTYLVGCKLSDEILKNQEKVFDLIGIEWVENIKNEINREIGKEIEKKTGKKLDRLNPDITILVDLRTESVRLQVRSLFVYGEYQKLIRGIPQATWYCPYCHGKGCVHCKGTGLLYPTSVQMIIEKPLLKLTKGKKTRFHGSGREDIDARCLAWRPFVIEVIKPKKRKIDLKKIKEAINKSRKVKVRKLKILTNGKEVIRNIKQAKHDKTYRAVVTFKKPIEKEKLYLLKKLEGVIQQRTPIRVVHRRADKLRKRRIKKISWKVLEKKKIEIKVRAEAGLYVKEVITGDEGRTKPSVAELIGNEVKKIELDVIKIY